MKTELSPHQQLIVHQAVKSAMEKPQKRGWMITKALLLAGLLSCIVSIKEGEPKVFLQFMIAVLMIIFLIHLFLTRTEDYIRGRVERDMNPVRYDVKLNAVHMVEMTPEWVCNTCAGMNHYNAESRKRARFYRNQCDYCNDVKFVFKVRDLEIDKM